MIASKAMNSVEQKMQNNEKNVKYDKIQTKNKITFFSKKPQSIPVE